MVYDSFSGEGAGGDLLRCLELTTFQSEAEDGEELEVDDRGVHGDGEEAGGAVAGSD